MTQDEGSSGDQWLLQLALSTILRFEIDITVVRHLAFGQITRAAMRTHEGRASTIGYYFKRRRLLSVVKLPLYRHDNTTMFVPDPDFGQ